MDPTGYDADPRVELTPAGWSFVWHGEIYRLAPADPAAFRAAWRAGLVDGAAEALYAFGRNGWAVTNPAGTQLLLYTDPDQALRFFLGDPRPADPIEGRPAAGPSTGGHTRPG